MPLDSLPTYDEIVEHIKSDITNYLPDVDPTIYGSFVRALMLSMAGRHYDSGLGLAQLIRMLFPLTATGEFLEGWARYEGITRNVALNASGRCIFTGVAGTAVPLLTAFSNAEGQAFSSSQAATLSAVSLSITSLTRSGTTVTATTASAHGLATGLSVTVSGAVETDYNGAFAITVLSTTTFTYEITGTPTTPATGTILAAYTGASIPVSADDAGTGGNLESGAVLSLVTPIAGVDADGYVTYAGLTGGADEETDESLLDRVLYSRANPVANFNEAAIVKALTAISGITRVFVKKIYPYIGAVTVAFMRDNDDGSPIPDSGEIAAALAAVLELLPANSDENDVFVVAPTAVPVAFTFSTITPNTSTMQEAITNSLTTFFKENATYETDVDEDKYRAAIINTFDTETGETLEDFTLSVPSGDITISTGEIGTLGSITYP